MSKKIFINNFDTFVSQAIFKELRNDLPDEDGNKPDSFNFIYGTYINKDSSNNKPDGVKKMLKVSFSRQLPCIWNEGNAGYKYGEQ